MDIKSDLIKTETFDEAIFRKYENIKVSVLSGVKPDNLSLVKSKEQFLSGDIDDPIFTYNKNTKIDYDESERQLQSLELELREHKTLPAIIGEQYLLVISEKLLKIKMLRQTQSLARGGDHGTLMKSFQECSERLYGTIDEDIFYGVMQLVEKELGRAVARGNLDDSKEMSVERLLKLIDNYKNIHPSYKSLIVTPRAMKKKSDSITDANELKLIFEKGLQQYGIDNDWKVVVDKKGTRSTISVSYSQQKIYLPCTEQLSHRSKRKKLTQARIQGLIAHEIGTHVLRYVNGKKSRLQLLSLGLHQYEQGEEGLATYREQCAQSLGGYAGFDAYFSIGLAKGVDGGPMRNFSGVHKVLTDYYFVIDNTSLQHARVLAWNRCVRTFRGTSGMIPGVVFTKDLIYRHGNIRQWEAVKNGTLTTTDIDSGKFDPTNHQHITFIQKLKNL